MDLLVRNPEIQSLTEIVKKRLYFAVVTPDLLLKNSNDTCYFNIDDEFVYLNYYYDFGPLNISCLYKYCCKLNDLLYANLYKRIVHYTSSDPQTKTNSAYLIGCFAVIFLQVPPREITRALLSSRVHFLSFVDASQGGSDWRISLIDCLSAIKKAHVYGFFNFDDFDVQEYDTYDKLRNGDINWLLPRKFLAFIGPTDYEIPNYHTPDFYIQYFINNDVKTVIRLNSTTTYNSSTFKSVGISHYDLFFPDGSSPPKTILNQFLEICELTTGAIAVHCKAGLGRTGSLIGAYLCKHYILTAKEAIAWMRICRPGSVIGQQQGWLEAMEGWLWRQGKKYRSEKFGDSNRISHHKYGIYSQQWHKQRDMMLRVCKQKELLVASIDKASRSEVSNYSYGSTKNVCSNVTYRKRDRRLSIVDTTQGDKLNSIKAHKQGTINTMNESRKNTIKTKNHTKDQLSKKK